MVHTDNTNPTALASQSINCMHLLHVNVLLLKYALTERTTESTKYVKQRFPATGSVVAIQHRSAANRFCNNQQYYGRLNWIILGLAKPAISDVVQSMQVCYPASAASNKIP